MAKAGNISKAAKELYISQPAISKAISKLEDSLGLSLFTRSSRGVQLTSEGEILFEHTKEAFDTLSRGEQELKRIQEFDIGHLRIGVSNTLCKYVLLPYLKTFIDQYPHMKITIESQSTAQTLSRFRTAETGSWISCRTVSSQRSGIYPCYGYTGYLCGHTSLSE